MAGFQTNRTRLGVRADDLRLEPREALAAARKLGFQVVELGAVEGAISPENLSRTGRRDLVHHVNSLGLELGALSAAPRGGGYADPRRGEAHLERSLRILDMAAELKAPVVTTSVVAGDADPGALARVREALATLADRADRAGVVLAVTPRGGEPQWLADTVRAMQCPRLLACVDTGEWLARGEDVAQVVEQWMGKVGWAHVRDAVPGSRDRPGYEVAAGRGALDPERLLAALEGAGYAGPLVLGREGGDSPVNDLKLALAQWRR